MSWQDSPHRRGALLNLIAPTILSAAEPDWDEACPGFVEVDLVGHEGGLGRGDYAQTLDVTDLHSGWTELAAVRNKAQVWVFEALQQIRERLPFELLGLDSDNGAEFINYQLHRYCEQEQITFTRSRPLRKNDNCFVEQKNYSVVRRFAGYARYDTEIPLTGHLSSTVWHSPCYHWRRGQKK